MRDEEVKNLKFDFLWITLVTIPLGRRVTKMAPVDEGYWYSDIII